jgi:hypothetical protein
MDSLKKLTNTLQQQQVNSHRLEITRNIEQTLEELAEEVGREGTTWSLINKLPGRNKKSDDLDSTALTSDLERERSVRTIHM